MPTKRESKCPKTIWSITGEELKKYIESTTQRTEKEQILKKMEQVLCDSDSLAEENRRLMSYLRQDIPVSIITGLKGNGKTLCTTIKRRFIRDKQYLCIPSNGRCSSDGEVISVSTILLKNLNASRGESRSITKEFILRLRRYWVLTFYLAFSSQFLREYPEYSETFRNENSDFSDMIEDCAKLTIVGIMNRVLQLSPDEANDILAIIQEKVKFFKRKLSEGNKKYIFIIDALDQIPYEFLGKRPEWFCWDTPLMDCVGIALLLVCAESSFFDETVMIFATIRQETFLSYKYGYTFDHTENRQMNTVNLYYCKDTVESMYRNYIIEDDNRYRIGKENRRILRGLYDNTTELSKTFVGVSAIYNNNRQMDEMLFDYIYRHTFRRARDLTKICEELAKRIDSVRQGVQKGSSISVIVKNIVDKKIAENHFSYFFEYCNDLFCNANDNQFWHVFDEDFYSCIPSDIISIEMGNRIREYYHGLHPEYAQIDPLNVYYQIGLLGGFMKNGDKYSYKIKPVEEIRKLDDDIVSSSSIPQGISFYTVHTVLAKMICVARQESGKQSFYYSKSVVLNTDEEITVKNYNSILEEIKGVEECYKDDTANGAIKSSEGYESSGEKENRMKESANGSTEKNNSMTINAGSGAQIFVAQNCEKVYSNYETGIDANELVKLLDAIENTATNLNISKEEKETLDESLETIKTEAQLSKPKKSLIKTALNGLKGIKGTVEFTAAVATLVDFFQKIIG